MPEDTKELRPDDLLFANFAVTFMDILGQSEDLKGCGFAPGNREEAIRLARSFFTKIENLHDWFDDFFKHSQAEPDVSNVPERFRDDFRKNMQCNIDFQKFSDGLMAYTSLHTETKTAPLNGIYSLLATSGTICLMSLAHGQPMRAGIEAAWGVQKEGWAGSKELYGCAVAEAYALESKIADYPRVVVGKNLIQYLSDMKNLKGSEIADEIVRNMAELCLNIIVQDQDGQYIVDYLGKTFNQSNPDIVEQYRNEAIAFINNQIEIHVANQDKKLEERYKKLLHYFAQYQNSSLLNGFAKAHFS